MFPSDVASRFLLLAGLAASLALLGFVCMLPAIPTQDGPIHVYYGEVIRQLLFDGGAFGGHFYIKRFLPPYALHEYMLALLLGLFEPVQAEKAVLSIYLVLFLGGAGRLARSLGGNLWCGVLFAAPLALNKTVNLGFQNYNLGVALMLWAGAVWADYALHQRQAMKWWFVGLAWLTMLAHPVPFGLLLGFAAILWWRAANRRQAMWALLAGALPALYVASYFERGQEQSLTIDMSEQMVTAMLHMQFVAPLHGLGSSMVLRLLGGAALVMLAPAVFQRGFGSPAILTSAYGSILFLASAVVPPVVNGGYFFPERLAIAGFALLLAAAGGAANGRKAMFLCAAALPFCTGYVVWREWKAMHPIAVEIAALWRTSATPVSGTGVIVENSQSCSLAVTHNPYRWNPLAYFVATSSVAANNVAMDKSYMILGARASNWSGEPNEVLHRLEEAKPGEVDLDFALEARACGDMAAGRVAEALRRHGMVAVSGWGNKHIRLYARWRHSPP